MLTLKIIGIIIFGYNCFLMGYSWEDVTRDYGFAGRSLYIILVLTVGFLFNIYELLSDGLGQLFSYLGALTQIEFWFRYYIRPKSFNARYNVVDEYMIAQIGYKLEKYTSKRKGILR